MKIGCMIWRIGDRLDFFEQLDWVRGNAFEEVSFWSFPGQPGKWQGFDLVAAGPGDLARLKRALCDFEDVDIHAPSAPWSDLDTGLASQDSATQQRALDALRRLIERSAECAAKVLTIHTGQQSGLPHSVWHNRFADSLAKADSVACQYGVRIAVELTSDYDLAMAPGLQNIGLTVDTGHMQFHEGAGFREHGSLGALIEFVRSRVFHMHMHDYDGKDDHLAIGSGHINFQEILRALRRIGYNGSLCLELNPAVVGPDEILESREVLARMIANLS